MAVCWFLFSLSGANAEARRPDGRCSPSGSLSDPSEQEAARTWKRHHHMKVTERAQTPRIAQTGSLRAQKPFRRLDKETAGNVKHNYRNVLHHSQFIERCLDYWFWNYSCASINYYIILCVSIVASSCHRLFFRGWTWLLSVWQTCTLCSQTIQWRAKVEKRFCFYLNVRSHSTEKMRLASAQWHNFFSPPSYRK